MNTEVVTRCSVAVMQLWSDEIKVKGKNRAGCGFTSQMNYVINSRSELVFALFLRFR
jgi:hypothetical protein